MRTHWLTALGALGLTLPGAAQNFDPPQAVDVDPDPNVVEVFMEAKVIQWQYFPVSQPQVLTDVWAYGDQTSGVFSIPGPTIEANLGDTVRVHFKNSLPEATTIHWHGLEAPATQDGSHIAQDPIQPGESFTYEFPVLSASFNWYHPHVKPFDGVERGLYGGLLLRDPAIEGPLGLYGMEEHLVFFDDVLLDASFQVIPTFAVTDPLKNAEYHLNGREGNWLLINGREAGEVQLDVPNGVPQRWRCVNVANTTFCRLDVQDADDGFDVKLWLIGHDAGLQDIPYKARRPVAISGSAAAPEHPSQAQTGKQLWTGILLLPGERRDQVFTPRGNDGEVFQVFQWDWFRGRHVAEYGMSGEIVLKDDLMDGLYPTLRYFSMRVVGPDPGTPEWEPPFELWASLVQVPPLPGPPVGTLPVTFGHGNPDANGNVTLFSQMGMVGGVMTPLPTAKIDSFNAHDVNVGEVWDWEVTNLTHGDHPFHAHGFFFEFIDWVWEDDDDPLNPNLNFSFTTNRRWIKDTIRIPARIGAKGVSRTKTRLRVRFDDTGREGDADAAGMLATFKPDGSWTSGGWLFHCHVLEHSGKGMLSVLEVHDPAEVFRLLGKQTLGTGGLFPSLTAVGDLSPGTDVVVDLVDARPGKKVWLVIGDEARRRIITAGELVPGVSTAGAGKPFLGVTSATTSPAGTFTWNLDQWSTCPSGTQIYLQAAVRDPSAVGRLALSNALTFTVP
jgi:FtsP/CotA-like multicopper oxidase with cupredoxin domain